MHRAAAASALMCPGYSDDRVGLARYSMQQLLLSDDQMKTFRSSASAILRPELCGGVTKAQALAFIRNNANWNSLGGTDYDAALQQAITSSARVASPSQQSVVYFMSDGAPTSGGGITSDGSGNNVSIAEWENHITSKGIDQVFAIGIGNGVNVDNLEPIAYPNTDVQPPSGVEDNVILLSTSDVAALPNRLQDAPRTPLHNRWQYFVQRSGHEHWCRQLRRRRRADFIDYDRRHHYNYIRHRAAMTSRQVPAHSRLRTRRSSPSRPAPAARSRSSLQVRRPRRRRL